QWYRRGIDVAFAVAFPAIKPKEFHEDDKLDEAQLAKWIGQAAAFLHFTSSTTSGSACLMRTRMRASVSPRQSPSSLILASISREGDSPPFSSFAPLFFRVVVVFFMGVAYHR